MEIVNLIQLFSANLCDVIVFICWSCDITCDVWDGEHATASLFNEPDSPAADGMISTVGV